MRLLFCGKLDLPDMPALCELAVMGLCRPARYLPPWSPDLRSLLPLPTYSMFMTRIDPVRRLCWQWPEILGNSPVVEFPDQI